MPDLRRNGYIQTPSRRRVFLTWTCQLLLLKTGWLSPTLDLDTPKEANYTFILTREWWAASTQQSVAPITVFNRAQLTLFNLAYNAVARTASAKCSF